MDVDADITTDNTAGNDVPVESLMALLLRFQRELHDIARAIEAVEHVLLKPGHSLDAVDLTCVQGLDLAVQRTRGLADFAAALSSEVPEDWLVDTTTAINLLRLEDMRRRLRADEAATGHRAVGELDLF